MLPSSSSNWRGASSGLEGWIVGRLEGFNAEPLTRAPVDPLTPLWLAAATSFGLPGLPRPMTNCCGTHVAVAVGVRVMLGMRVMVDVSVELLKVGVLVTVGKGVRVVTQSADALKISAYPGSGALP